MIADRDSLLTVCWEDDGTDGSLARRFINDTVRDHGLSVLTVERQDGMMVFRLGETR